MVVGPDGQIAVPLYQDYQVWIYDRMGNRVAKVGRQGDGPGEFQRVSPAGWLGDTLWVHDPQSNRITYVGGDGSLLRTRSLPTGIRVSMPDGSDPPGDVFGFTVDALYADGSMLGRGTVFGPGTPSGIVLLLDADGEARWLAEPPSGSSDPRWSLYVEGFYRSAPFAMTPKFAAAPDGSRFASLYGEVTSTQGGVVTLSVLTPAGDTALFRRYPFDGVPVPASMRDSALAAILPPPGSPPPREGPPDLPERMHELARDRMWPVFAPVTAFQLGLDSTMWITLRETSEGQTVIVLDLQGDPLASVLLPAHSTLRQASRTHLWVTETDGLGLASVVRYRLEGVGGR